MNNCVVCIVYLVQLERLKVGDRSGQGKQPEWENMLTDTPHTYGKETSGKI